MSKIEIKILPAGVSRHDANADEVALVIKGQESARPFVELTWMGQTRTFDGNELTEALLRASCQPGILLRPEHFQISVGG